ncbi:hypothetical protein RSOLAG22IIIB_05121 [Rhizoctonia solani]|uniref:Uncharacterized protein n=1 Tax=Rhizoctonia solani TaxID=456999 RepID=A0A0K6G3N3_9AGAM|nr:hypothetical protein RSOLAG22IIIB_05121 [Rhizoctonia solani]
MLALRYFMLLAFSALTGAIPTLYETPNLPKRTISGAAAADCDGTQFTSDEVQIAAQVAASRINNHTQVGRSKYPHQFNNMEGFDFLPDCTAPFFEFPIFNDKIYTGGKNNNEKPGADRVIIGSLKGADAAFCEFFAMKKVRISLKGLYFAQFRIVGVFLMSPYITNKVKI